MAVLSYDHVLEATRTLTRELIAPAAESVDRDAVWPDAALAALREEGLGGLTVPRAYGGCGQGALALAQVCEIMATYCPSTALCFGMHCVGASVMATNPTPDHAGRFLGPIAAGEHLTTLALSESGSGSHFYFPETRMSRVGEQYRLNGGKAFVTNGGHADSYVASAVSETTGVQVPTFSCVVVPAGTPGVSFGPPWRGLGMRGNSSRTMKLDDVRVPAANLLGREGDQIWYVFNVIAPYFLMAMAGTYLGVAAAALNEAIDHLRSRHYSHSGGVLGDSTVLQHRLGCLWAQVERTRQLIYHAAAGFDRGDEDSLAAVMSSKAEVAGCAVDVVNEVMTLTGGVGYREDSRLHRMLRDARAAHLMSPTTDMLRVWVGRTLLDRPLLGD